LEREAVRCIVKSENIPIELVQLVDIIDSSSADENWDDSLEADIQFHTMLVKSANSPRLERLYAAIFAEVKLCIYQGRFLSTFNHESVAHHRQLLSAMESGDLQAAYDILCTHIDSALQHYQAAFEKL
jgi:DNA-binding GntR family transcriptional regulator